MVTEAGRQTWVGPATSGHRRGRATAAAGASETATEARSTSPGLVVIAVSAAILVGILGDRPPSCWLHLPSIGVICLFIVALVATCSYNHLDNHLHSVLAKRLSGKIVSERIHFEHSGTENITPVNNSVLLVLIDTFVAILVTVLAAILVSISAAYIYRLPCVPHAS